MKHIHEDQMLVRRGHLKSTNISHQLIPGKNYKYDLDMGLAPPNRTIMILKHEVDSPWLLCM